MRPFCLLIGFALLLGSCQHLSDAPVPYRPWPQFAAAKEPLRSSGYEDLQGLYAFGEGKDFFGKKAVARWSYTLNGNDTVYHLSFFMEEEAAYFILEGRKEGDRLLFSGYWRKMVNTETGLVRLEGSAAGGGARQWRGWFGRGSEEPEEALQLRRLKPLEKEEPLTVIAHRGGGRNNDLLPASENSVEMLKLAARMGATGVEIDVKLTSDGVPVLYHDDRINDRLTRKSGIRGTLSSYTYRELQEKIQLKRGGKIPTLEQALDTILYRTPLTLVWLDCKLEGSLEEVRRLQELYTAKAAEAGRRLEIVLGIPDDAALESLVRSPNFRKLPVLTELDTGVARRISANIWAPSWTKGVQQPESAAMQQQGRRVFMWTLDTKLQLRHFLSVGSYNGILTNRPSMVAYYAYAGLD
jgi:glycerophosphoryl diester phosphodiesterase